MLTVADQASLHVRSTHVLRSFPGPFYYIFLPPVVPPILPPPVPLPLPLLFLRAKSIKSPGRGCFFFSFPLPCIRTFLLRRGVALGKPHDCEKPGVNKKIYIYIYIKKRKKEMFSKKKIPTLLHDKRIKKAANHDRWRAKKSSFFSALVKSGIVL